MITADQPDDLILTDAEAGSPLWKKIERHLLARRERHRVRNDMPLHPDDTTMLRGRIAEITLLLGAGKREE